MGRLFHIQNGVIKWQMRCLHFKLMTPSKTIVDCRWMYTVKVGIDDHFDRLKLLKDTLKFMDKIAYILSLLLPR